MRLAKKINYPVSLIRQVETGLERGYSEKEILNAIINAISPGLQIRSYLEGSGSIPLARLRKKFALSAKIKKVNEISVTEKESSQKVDNSEKILAAVEQMRCEVAAIKTELDKVKNSQKEGAKSNKTIKRPRCTSCKEAEILNCDHCSMCGSSDNFSEVVKRENRETTGGYRSGTAVSL